MTPPAARKGADQPELEPDAGPLELGVAAVGLRFTGNPAGELVGAAGRAQEELGHGSSRVVDDFIVVAVEPARMREALDAIRALSSSSSEE